MIVSDMSIRLDNLTVPHPADRAYRAGRGRPRPPLVRGIAAEAHAGRLTAVLGPNGAGKTSLLHAVLEPPGPGCVTLGGRDRFGDAAAERARRLALIPQHSRDTLGFTVGECVRMGRHPHGDAGRWCRGGGVVRVLEAVGFDPGVGWAGRRLDTLSGGEHRRVLVARAAAQIDVADGDANDTAVLADEPTAGLDPRHAEAVLALLRGWSRTRPVLVVLHDLDAAARYADDAWLMADGALVHAGPVAEVLTAERLEAVYGLRFGTTPKLGPLPEAATGGREAREARTAKGAGPIDPPDSMP